jgi:hypothetical protein
MSVIIDVAFVDLLPIYRRTDSAVRPASSVSVATVLRKVRKVSQATENDDS